MVTGPRGLLKRIKRLFLGRKGRCVAYIAVVIWLMTLPALAASVPSGGAADSTVMVFMNAKNNLECFGLQNFEQMAAIGSSDKVNVLVELGRPKNHQSCASGVELWSGLLRYRVTDGMKATIHESIKGSFVVDGPTADMGNEKTLSSFIKWSKKSYPAKHYMLVVWNHGQGFRLLLTKAASARMATRLAPNATLSVAEPRITGGVRSVSFDDDSGHHLFNSDVTQALEENFTQPIDVLGFDACLMSMVETGYQMKGVARSLIGSEELEPGTGWNYTSLLKSLRGTDPTADSIARELETTYQKENEEQHATLSMVNLDAIDELAKAVSGWAKALTKGLQGDVTGPRERDALSKSRADCKPYGEWYDASDPALRTSVDLHRLAALDAANSSDPAIQTAAKKIVGLIESRKLVGSRYASQSSSDDFGYGSWGIAIYFPATLADFKADQQNSPGYVVGNTDHPVQFVDKEKWARFLQSYYLAQNTVE